jgi:hypothetical protein
MAYSPEIKTAAYELYLDGMSPGEIAAELKRRHPQADTPSAKTVEKWAYVPQDGQTWSERRYAAETAARDAVNKDFITSKSAILSGTIKLHQKLQERVLRAFENADDATPENLTQEVYALVNCTRTLDKMLDSKLAEEARQRDAIDCLIEAMRRTVPNWQELEPKINFEYQKLVNSK